MHEAPRLLLQRTVPDLYYPPPPNAPNSELFFRLTHGAPRNNKKKRRPCPARCLSHTLPRSLYKLLTMARRANFTLGCVALCLWAAIPAESTREDPFGLRHHHRDLSLDELTVEAAKHGMEVIPPEEWMETRRRLQYTGGSSFPE